uniref:hypothetical protein n=1 Tax=Hydrogenophaga sp. TaxID=1904254 RepID=UPI00356AAF22
MKLAHLLLTGLVGLIAACGGGGSSVTTSVSGAIVKGPVNGATVTFKRPDGSVIATTTTNSTGAYSLALSYSGDLVIEASGGTYLDEATGTTTTLATPMKAVLTANGGSVTGMVTPLTTMAYTYAFPSGSAVTASGFNSMASKVAAQFKLPGVNLVSTLPNVTGTPNDYGKVLAAVSQYLKDNPVGLAALINTSFNTAQWASFSTAFSTAYATAVPGSAITFSFDGSAFSIGGTGAGGGSGTCGVAASGTVTTGNI